MLFFLSFLLLFEKDLILPSLLAAAFHECGHLLFARLLRVPISELSLDLFGARITVSSGLISYGSEFLLALAGPLFSFLLASLIQVPLGSFLSSLKEASLFLGALNLLPIRGFDGGRMLTSFVLRFFSPSVATFLDRLLTGAFLIFLWGISVYLLLVKSGGLPLFVFSVGVFSKIFLA